MAQSSKGASPTLNHSPFSPLLSNRSRRYKSLYSQSNHHKRDSHITRSKISFSLIEPQPLPSSPAYGHEFHALAFHPHPTFAEPLVGSAFKIWSDVCGGVFLRKQLVWAVGSLRRGPPSLIFGNCVLGGFHHWNYTRESWTPAS